MRQYLTLIALLGTLGPKGAVALGAEIVAATSGPIALKSEPITVLLRTSPRAGEKGLLKEFLNQPGNSDHVYLIVREVHTDHQPGVAYNLFLNIPPDAPSNALAQYLIGTLNFYSASSTESVHKTTRPVFNSFDITGLADSLMKRGDLTDTPRITISPVGVPLDEAHPTIGAIELLLKKKD